MISIALAAYSPSAEQAKKAVNFSRSIDEVMAFLINHLVGPKPHLVYGRSAQDCSASYQERYLWIPMESSGGLADKSVAMMLHLVVIEMKLHRCFRGQDSI